MVYNRIICIGDSLVYGARTYMGLAEHLAEKLNENSEVLWICENYGKNGDKAIDVLRRLKDINFKGARFCIIWVGTNDLKYNCTPIDRFRETYKQILDYLACKGIFVICLGLFKPFKGFGHAPYNTITLEDSGMVQTFNSIIKKLCDHKADFVDIAGVINKDYMADAVHLNEYGYYAIAEIVANVLKQY